MSCNNCDSLTEISTLSALKTLTCDDCTNLTKISKNPKLEYLGCINCRSLTEIPKCDTVRCFGCPWLSAENLTKLKFLQKCWKRFYIGRKLERLIPKILDIYYSPGCKGYFLAKKHFENK